MGCYCISYSGGGKALMNSYYAAAERAGIGVVYDAEVVGLDLADGQFQAALVRIGGPLRLEHLERHGTVYGCLPRGVDDTHATLSKL